MAIFNKSHGKSRIHLLRVRMRMNDGERGREQKDLKIHPWDHISQRSFLKCDLIRGMFDLIFYMQWVGGILLCFFV